MTEYVALVRAVNVGGTGRLPMKKMADICRTAGFCEIRPYIASGNVALGGESAVSEVRSILKDQLSAYTGTNAGVMVRTVAEIADTLARSPFTDAPGNRVMTLFIDGPLPTDPFDGLNGGSRLSPNEAVSFQVFTDTQEETDRD